MGGTFGFPGQVWLLPAAAGRPGSQCAGLGEAEGHFLHPEVSPLGWGAPCTPRCSVPAARPCLAFPPPRGAAFSGAAPVHSPSPRLLACRLTRWGHIGHRAMRGPVGGQAEQLGAQVMTPTPHPTLWMAAWGPSLTSSHLVPGASKGTGGEGHLPTCLHSARGSWKRLPEVGSGELHWPAGGPGHWTPCGRPQAAAPPWPPPSPALRVPQTPRGGRGRGQVSAGDWGLPLRFLSLLPPRPPAAQSLGLPPCPGLRPSGQTGGQTDGQRDRPAPSSR